MTKAMTSFLLAGLVTGCMSIDSNRIVSQPSNIGIENALSQVGRGFGRMKQSLGDTQLGLYPCKITINLNVTASANESGKLVLDLQASPPTNALNASASAKGEATAGAEAKRGNSMVVEMYNPLCLPPSTLAYEKPDKYPLIIENIPDEEPLALPPLD